MHPVFPIFCWYTRSFVLPTHQNIGGLRSGDLGGRSCGPPRPITSTREARSRVHPVEFLEEVLGPRIEGRSHAQLRFFKIRVELLAGVLVRISRVVATACKPRHISSVFEMSSRGLCPLVDVRKGVIHSIFRLSLTVRTEWNLSRPHFLLAVLHTVAIFSWYASIFSWSAFISSWPALISARICSWSVFIVYWPPYSLERRLWQQQSFFVRSPSLLGGRSWRCPPSQPSFPDWPPPWPLSFLERLHHFFAGLFSSTRHRIICSISVI